MKYIVDFSRVCDVNYLEALRRIQELKKQSPEFKCTLFIIPQRTGPETIDALKNIDWIQLAAHGWRHTKGECLAWTDEEAKDKLETVAKRGIDAPIFRAPEWLLDGDVYTACMELNYLISTDRAFSLGSNLEYVYDAPPRGYFGVSNDFNRSFKKEDKFFYPQEIIKCA